MSIPGYLTPPEGYCMCNMLATRNLKWIGDDDIAQTPYIFLEEFESGDYVVQLSVAFHRYRQPDDSIDIEQRYSYKILDAMLKEEITNQRGLQLVHPQQAVKSAERWLDKHITRLR